MTTLEVDWDAMHLTKYAERRIAQAMYVRGKSFLGAAMLLRKDGAYEYVVLHLMCQGIEITLKALLLFANYGAYKPKLRKYGRSGHDILPIAIDVAAAFNLSPLREPLKQELGTLGVLYSKHVLRYGGRHDLFVNPQTIQSERVLRRMVAVVRLTERELERAKSSNAAN